MIQIPGVNGGRLGFETNRGLIGLICLDPGIILPVNVVIQASVGR